MFVLNLFDYIIVLVILFNFGCLFESCLSYAKTRFFDDKIWIFLLFFNNSCSYVIVNEIIATDWRSLLFLF